MSGRNSGGWEKGVAKAYILFDVRIYTPTFILRKYNFSEASSGLDIATTVRMWEWNRNGTGRDIENQRGKEAQRCLSMCMLYSC